MESENLYSLAKYFPTSLYIVGGAVRDFLLGYNSAKDIDLASELIQGEVFALLKGTPFCVSTTSPKMGTLKISYQKESYEYTTFRIDSYQNDGSHTPSSVKFTRDIKKDALRRDFTINAIYYDIKTKEFLDYTGGIKDLKNKLIKTTHSPSKVFREDALRILRMVRQASQLGFDIDAETYQTAKTLVSTIKNLAIERVRDEFDKMLVADTAYGKSGGHIRAINMLIDLGVMDIILPELLEGKGVAQRADFHKYDVFGHSLKVFEYSPPEIRLAALLHDICKPKVLKETGKMVGHDIAGAHLTREIMGRLKYPNAQTAHTVKLVRNHMYDVSGNTGEKKLRLFILKNVDIIEDLIKLKQADYLGSGWGKGISPTAKRMEGLYDKMKQEGVAFYIRELKVWGKDLIDLGIPPQKRGELLEELLKLNANLENMRDRDAQLNFLKKKGQEKSKKGSNKNLT